MIDPRVLRDDPDRVRAAQAKRGLSADIVDVALAADRARRDAIVEFEAKRGEQKTLGKQVAQAQGDEKQDLLTRTKALATEVKALEATQTEADEAWTAALMSLPNLAADEAPAGGEDDFVVLETVGTPRDFAAEGFEPRDHIELGRMLGAIDIERGAKVSGSRFYFLTGVGAQLELALINLAMEQARNAGFTQVIAPALVRPRAMDGTGFLGQAADDVYKIEGEDLYLVGTSEVPMAAYHSDEILDAASLPLRYAAFSPCFRKEAGSHGKDTKGIIRVHWFDKVEMFVYTTTEESYAEHQRLLEWEKEFLDKLELAYRVIDVAAGDLGLSAIRKFDCEAWIPTQGKYRELTSTSNCTEFQTRRLDTRGRFPPTARPADLHPQRHALRDDAHDRGDPRDPPAGRRLGHGAAGAAPAHGWPRGAETRLVTDLSWRPQVVALDIDGTLLSWVEGQGMTHAQVTPAVHDAVHRALDAGAHVVLASGRSPHGMTPVADMLELPSALGATGSERLWIVASNGAVVFRYPPMEVVLEETFDAAPAVRAVLERHPSALVAVEERGVGYRVSKEFPTGELSGEMILTDVEDLVAGPVSRVIIRDPQATAEDFVKLASELGLHGTDYVVGWTAWLDLAPVGVTKASGLQYVVDQLGLTAADTLAIGDGRNDIEMLQWAGRGVAMGQAVQSVIDAADDVTGVVSEDGAATEIGRWF